MSSLPLEAESLDQVPESHRSLYSPKDGKFVLDAAPRKDLHRFLDSKRQAEEQARKVSGQWDGLDPQEAREALELKRSLETQELLKKGDVEGLLSKERAKLSAQAQREKAELEQKLSALSQREQRYVRDEALTKAALAQGVRPEFVEDVLLHGATKLRVEDGELVDGDGAKVDPSKWLKDLLVKRKSWLGESVGGGTEPKATSSGSPRGDLKRSSMSYEERADYQKRFGMAAYRKLPA